MTEPPPRFQPFPEEQGPLERIYDTQILPLAQRMREICLEYGIDYILFFALDEHADHCQNAGAANLIRPCLDRERLAWEILRGRMQPLVISESDLEPPPQGQA